MKQERFYPLGITRDPNAKVKHFTPNEDHKDSFGNKFFSSPNLAYIDGLGEKVKAGILISPEGQDFLHRHTGILKDIDYGLATLEGPGKVAPERSVDLGGRKTLEKVTAGGQSNFYVLTVDGKKYAIKTHTQSKPNQEEFSQPYINEMLQTQSMAKNLEHEFQILKIRLSTFLFATGQVSCTLFEEDTKNYRMLTEEYLYKISGLAFQYIKNQKNKQNALFENVLVDWFEDSDKREKYGLRNFRVRPDGIVVWIDPFLYVRPKS